jgi:hypothetical protein
VPRNGESLSSDAQKPTKRKHGISNAARTRVKYDFLNLAQELSSRIADVVFEQARCSQKAIVYCAIPSHRDWRIGSRTVEHADSMMSGSLSPAPLAIRSVSNDNSIQR